MTSLRLLLISTLALTILSSEASAAPREHLDFDADWLFYRNDPTDLKGELDYTKVKGSLLAATAEFSKSTDGPTQSFDQNLGSDVPAAKDDFDDTSWRKLNLPHDWAVEGPFDISKPGETGKLPYEGVGWYRKHFDLPASDSGRQIALELDGAMSYSLIWVNGHFAGGWPYGYTSFSVDITPYLQFGKSNVIAIRLNNPANSSRWYPGAGIYRDVWLTKTSPVHVAHWGTYITTPVVSADSATVKMKVSLQNQSNQDASVTASTEICEMVDGNPTTPVVSFPSTTATIPTGKKTDTEMTVELPHPTLWDTQNPKLYAAVTKLTQDGNVVDEYVTPFGVRTIKFDVEQGFLLNGKRVPLNGVCGHHDLGALGAAFNHRALQRQFEILKEMGVNAFRTSHNMPDPVFLDLCDQMGILVMDESFDCWQRGKKSGDYHNLYNDWMERDLRAEYRRDRNHPSVILWSLGNEIPEQGKKESVPLVSRMVAIAHDEDPTRPATEGCNNGQHFDPDYVKALDVFGENYDAGMYADFHAKYPDMPVYTSESSSTCSSRGVYFLPDTAKLGNFQVSSYDCYVPGWATLPDTQFKALDQHQFVAGEFVWTGFDYLGEPTPYNSDMTNLLNFRDNPAEQAKMEAELKSFGKIKCPSRSSYFGIVDLCGFKKDRFYLYQARWRPDLPMVHILPDWNWAGQEGKPVPVYVYSSGDEVELFLNGASLGRKKLDPLTYRFIWKDVNYAPGELKAVAYKEGKEWAQTSVKTTGKPVGIQLEADQSKIHADGKDLSYVTVRVVDANGLTVPTDHSDITFSMDGPGEIVATDNGDPTDLTVFSRPERHAFYGMALAIIRAPAGHSGVLHLTAKAEGLSSGSCDIQTN